MQVSGMDAVQQSQRPAEVTESRRVLSVCVLRVAAPAEVSMAGVAGS